jgi:hypothetical protein
VLEVLIPNDPAQPLAPTVCLPTRDTSNREAAIKLLDAVHQPQILLLHDHAPRSTGMEL